jgi:uncharacterized protein YdeI (BOF family)
MSRHPRQLLLAGLVAAVLAGCSERAPRNLGAAFEGRPVPIREAAAGADSVLIAGAMTEKCPVAGCWFMLEDESGTIKVDTKNAGFVVVDVPLKSKMIVSGKVVTNGSERLLEATGLRY